MRHREGKVVVVLEEVKDRLRQQLGHDADVVSEVEAIDQMDAFAITNRY